MTRFTRSNTPRLSEEEAIRQGRAARLAYEAMPAGTAIAFLNTHNKALGGRPIDLALESAAGLIAVERAIAAFGA